MNYVDGKATTANVVVTQGSDGKETVNVSYDINVDGKTTKITYVTGSGEQQKAVYEKDGKFYTQPNGQGDEIQAAQVRSQITAIAPTFTANEKRG